MLSSSEVLELIMSVSKLRRENVEKIAKEYYLAPIEVEILSFLYIFPHGTTATDIEKHRALKKNTISVHVENLVQMGFLERLEHKNDRRRVCLTLSDKAKSIAVRAQKENDALAHRLGEGISAEDQAILDRCLSIIKANAERYITEER